MQKEALTEILLLLIKDNGGLVMARIKILVVDDEARMRKIVRDFLVHKDFDVIEAENGEQAVDIFFKNKNIALIINLFICVIILFSLNKDISLPTIGIIHKSVSNRGNKALRLNKQEYISIPFSFIAFLVGFIDGDGYIQVTKTSKGFITIKLVISLHLEDISSLEYIHSVLKIGKINVYKDLRSPTCKLVINKTDLQEILFPLLIYHKIFFLTTRRIDQFNLAMYIMKNDIKMYNKIPSINTIPVVFDIPKTPLDYTLLHFFKN